MRSIRDLLAEKFKAAMVNVLGPDSESMHALLAPTRDDRFGDYQCNVAMSAAKRFRRKPRDLATELIEAVSDGEFLEMCEPPDIAGPGFINLKLRPAWLASELSGTSLSLSSGEPRTAVVDYSSPNVAKELHVGHIRSTIIGDVICRILEFAGHRVIRQNHVGDWGTQFGLLCAYLKARPESLQSGISDLEELYRQARTLAEEDPEFRERSRAEVVALQEGEATSRQAWEQVIKLSRQHYMPLYRRLGVLLREEDERGESFYNDRLPGVVQDLRTKFGDGERLRVAESDGAVCVFHCDKEGKPRFHNAQEEPLPFIVQKSDGAFLYATTDVAALRFRVDELGADWIVYVTDARQKLHFEMLFATVREAGYAPPERIRLEHVTFGSILGEDRKPFKTRDGGTIKLGELLDEAVERAEKQVDESRGFSQEEIQDIAEAVGIGAIKYADLCQNRSTDYVFSWDKLLSLEGNTAPYMMYAYARIRSIIRKGGDFEPGPVNALEDAERNLVLALLRFAETLDCVQEDWRINTLADYLYGLAGLFMKFYETCPVLKAEPEQRLSRLRLCERTAEVLKTGLGLLGIRVLERM